MAYAAVLTSSPNRWALSFALSAGEVPAAIPLVLPSKRPGSAFVVDQLNVSAAPNEPDAGVATNGMFTAVMYDVQDSEIATFDASNQWQYAFCAAHAFNNEDADRTGSSSSIIASGLGPTGEFGLPSGVTQVPTREGPRTRGGSNLAVNFHAYQADVGTVLPDMLLTASGHFSSPLPGERVILSQPDPSVLTRTLIGGGRFQTFTKLDGVTQAYVGPIPGIPTNNHFALDQSMFVPLNFAVLEMATATGGSLTTAYGQPRVLFRTWVANEYHQYHVPGATGPNDVGIGIFSNEIPANVDVALMAWTTGRDLGPISDLRQAVLNG